MDVRQTVTQLYRAYESRDMDAVLNGLPHNFCFEWAFESSTAPYGGICHTKADLVNRLADIAAEFEFHSYRPTTILVDGNRAAAQLEVDLTSVATHQRFSARIAHFWEFEDGIPVHLVEYMDTALIASHSG